MLKELTLSKAQEQLLHEQVIDADRPGPLLRDLRMLLDFVGTQGVKAAGKYNLLPIDAIDELDQRLNRPLRLKLKRPQLRSHPYLQGLHLLLRASGLTRVVGTGDKARLVVDPAVLERWNELNPTEQYFTLLEAWLLVGRREMIGEQGSAFGGEYLSRGLETWRWIPAEGQKGNLQRPQDSFFVRLGRELALMDLFGLMEVEHPREAVHPWCPAAVRHLPLGDAVLTLLAGWYHSSLGELYDRNQEEGAGAIAFGLWQPLFQPYFPEWQKNLTLPRAEACEGIFIFRVALGDVWRRIAIASNSTLHDLITIILRSVRFDNDHLYAFTYRDRFGATVQAVHPFMDEGPSAEEVPIGALPLEPGQSMKLTYDFGDEWKFDIKLERIDPPGQRLKAPRVLESHGKAPEQYPNWE